jgi:hypothetical protein
MIDAHSHIELWRHCMAVYHGREKVIELGKWLDFVVGLPWPHWARAAVELCKPPV